MIRPYYNIPMYDQGTDNLIYKTKDDQYVDSQNRPVEQIGWTENGHLRFRDKDGNIGHSWYPSQGAVIKGVDRRTLELLEEPWLYHNTDFKFDLNIIKHDNLLNEYFSKDVYPRFSRYNNDVTPFIANVIQNAVNRFKPTEYTDLTSRMGAYNTTYYGTDKNGHTRWFNRKAPFLNYNLKYKLSRPVVVHEVTHGYRQGVIGDANPDKYGNLRSYSDPTIYNNVQSVGSGYSDNEIRMLENYGINYFDDNYSNIIESGTTNAEVRYRLWRDLKNVLGRTPSLKELDEYIKNYDNESLINIIKKANAYGENAVKNAEYLYNNGGQNMDKWIEDIKKTLMLIAKQDNSSDKNLNLVT